MNCFLGERSQREAAVMETSHLIRLDIKHYQELLKLNGISDEKRSIVRRLLADAEVQLASAEANEVMRKQA
jgi:hypothetical protein